MQLDMKALSKRRAKLVRLNKSLRYALNSLDLDSAERETVSRIQEKANKELRTCMEKLAPFQKEAQALRKQKSRIARSRAETKAKKRKAQSKSSEAMSAINQKIRKKREEIHKISKLNQQTARFVQGGSPGLGKKS